MTDENLRTRLASAERQRDEIVKVARRYSIWLPCDSVQPDFLEAIDEILGQGAVPSADSASLAEQLAVARTTLTAVTELADDWEASYQSTFTHLVAAQRLRRVLAGNPA